MFTYYLLCLLTCLLRLKYLTVIDFNTGDNISLLQTVRNFSFDLSGLNKLKVGDLRSILLANGVELTADRKADMVERVREIYQVEILLINNHSYLVAEK